MECGSTRVPGSSRHAVADEMIEIRAYAIREKGGTQLPQVTSVVSRVGRAEVGNDDAVHA